MIFFFQGVGIIFGALGSILDKPTHESDYLQAFHTHFAIFNFFILLFTFLALALKRNKSVKTVA